MSEVKQELDPIMVYQNGDVVQGKVLVNAGEINNRGGIFYTSKESDKPEKVEKEYDFVNPSHYQNFSVEVIDMMVRIWGKESTALHCEMCAFKYKMRSGDKPEQPIERDLEKAKWYINKAKELRNEKQN